MKKIENTTIYKCEYCGKIYQRECYANRHCKRCRKDPVNYSPCMSCKKLEMVDVDVEHEYTGNNVTLRMLMCSERGKYLRPRWSYEYVSNYSLFDVPTAEIQPSKCDRYEEVK